MPILHIEAHGYEHGIELADESLVPWARITPQLSAINQASRMNLLVVAMLCQGWNLMYHIIPTERSPLFMLVAPPQNTTHAEILSATLRFYEALVSHFDIYQALVAMNDGSPFENWRISPGTAEILFCRTFRLYLEGRTPQSLKKRENELVAGAVRARKLDLMQAAMFRELIRPMLHDHRALYDHLRAPFLMLDLFPENAPRFGLTYEKCIWAWPSEETGRANRPIDGGVNFPRFSERLQRSDRDSGQEVWNEEETRTEGVQ